MKFVAPFMFMCLFVGCSKSAGSNSATAAKNVGMSDQQKQNMTPNLSCYNAMRAWKKQYIEKSDAEAKVAEFKEVAAGVQPDQKGLVFGVEKASIAACTSDLVLNGQAFVLLQDRAADKGCTDGCVGNNQGKEPTEKILPEVQQLQIDSQQQSPQSPAAIETGLGSIESLNGNIVPQIIDAPP